jgi:GT2 family glycosyltransferase
MSGASRTIVLLGMMTKIPVSGVVWQTVHYLEGLRRLGYDVCYVEAHARTPSMFMDREEDDGSGRAAAFIENVMRRFGFGGCWAYHALHDDGHVYGMSDSALRRLYREAELILNLHGGTDPLPDQADTGRLVYVETDPVDIQVELHHSVQRTIDYLEPHCAFFTFGENFGGPDCGLPVADRFDFQPTRQPVVLDFWPQTGPPARDELTTIASWRQQWRTVTLDGETYYWSKDLEFAKFLELPARTGRRFELALGAYEPDDRALLEERGWSVREAAPLSGDLDLYREYVSGSRGEFTVAKDQNVRLRTGWFSDRSATYLAAGRPVVTQSTGFESVLPTGEGLLSFATLEEAVDAVEDVGSRYDRHSSAALEIAREHFDAGRVLRRLLDDVGVARAARTFPADLRLQPVSRRPTLLPEATVEDVLSRPLPESAPASDPPDTTVVVVAADGLPHTRLCVESLLAGADGLSLEVLVVDNASSDGTGEFLEALAARDARVGVVANGANLGFAPAVNQGLARARGRALVVLNNDTVLPPAALRLLVEHLEDVTLGLLGPVSNDAATEAEVDAGYETWGGLVRQARRRARDHAGEVVDLPVLTMFCVALRRDVYECVGPLDERFEMGFFEDDDYCLRVRDAGYRVAYAEDVLVHHAGEASFGALVPTGERGAIFTENRRRFEEKWEVDWEPHRLRVSPEYARLRERVRDVVLETVPPGGRVLVVSKGDDELLALDGRAATHFPQLDGSYAGFYPRDAADAIAQVRALHARGAGFLVFPETSLWWLDHYVELGRYLDERCAKTVAEDGSCIVYSLGGRF